MKATQLALEFGLQDDATFANYYQKHNTMACSAIIDMVYNTNEQFIYLWGTAGVGKTHLLQAACHLASKQGISSIYLPVENLITNFTIDCLNGLENINLVCLDNIQLIAKQSKLEEMVFYFFNAIKAAKNKLLIAAKQPPIQLNLGLADLQSRLSWGLVYQLHALEDEDKLLVLQLRAKARGLDLDEVVARFLLRRCSREMNYLFAILEQLDKASLAKQHKLTIPFVKQILNL